MARNRKRGRHTNARIIIRNDTTPPTGKPQASRPGRAPTKGDKRDRGFRVDNLVTTGGAPTRVSVWIYAEIGEWGVTAAEFVPALQAITADVIELHINSMGGDVFDGVAIFNALRAHPAQIEVHIDALAASAASFIAQAGDHVYIARNAQVMIHEASGLCYGNASDMAIMADLLEKCSDNIADIYTQKAGGTVAQWRKAMKVETWYSSKEAVAAGLADEVEVIEQDRAANEFDLSVFSFAGRAHAPAPVPIAAPGRDEPAVQDEPAVEERDREAAPQAKAEVVPSEEDTPPAEPVEAPVTFKFDPAAFASAMQASVAPDGFDAGDFHDAMAGVALDAPKPPEPERPTAAVEVDEPEPEPEPEDPMRPFATLFRDLMDGLALDAPSVPESLVPHPVATAPEPRAPEPEPEPVNPMQSFADLFRGAVVIAANDAPVPPQPKSPEPVPASDTGFSIELFRRALEEASL